MGNPGHAAAEITAGTVLFRGEDLLKIRKASAGPSGRSASRFSSRTRSRPESLVQRGIFRSASCSLCIAGNVEARPKKRAIEMMTGSGSRPPPPGSDD